MEGRRGARPGRVSLMRTAIALMGERGYEGTSTRTIAEAAGVSVAALYYHFPSKLDLLREFLVEAHDVVIARLARTIEEAGPGARAKLDAAVGALIWSSLHDDWARQAAMVAWREHGRLEPDDRAAIAKKRVQLVEQLEAVIRAGVASAELATDEPHEVAQAILTLCIGVVDPLAASRAPMDDVIAVNQRLAATLAGARS